MRRRLILLGIATVIAALVALGVPFAIVQARYRVLREYESETFVAASIAREVAVLLRTDLRTALTQTLEQQAGPKRVVAIFGRDGVQRVAAGGSAAYFDRQFRAADIASRLTDSETTWLRRTGNGLVSHAPPRPLLSRRPLLTAAPIRFGQETIGVVAVLSAPNGIHADIFRSWTKLLLGCLVLLCLAALAALPISRWIVHPMVELERGFDEVANGAETSRVNDRRGPPEVRSLAARFNLMADELQTSLQRQRNVVADASHQLRNPLTALRLRVEHLGLVLADQDESKHAPPPEYQRVVAGLDRMETIVEQLLQLARAARDVHAVAESPMHVVAEHVEEWRSLASDRAISVNVCAMTADSVLCQPGGLAQILEVLIDNAVKYAPTGSVVTLQSATMGARVTISVLDEGPGFHESDRPGYQVPVGRSDRVGSSSGLGRGLMIADGLARAVSGSIELGCGEFGGGLAVIELVRAPAPL